MKKYILMATDDFIADRFQREFSPYDNVSVWNGTFETLPGIDCLVSPGNSFGLMDGGMDQAIVNYFGDEIQIKVQSVISDVFYSEQPIGTSFIVGTGDDSIPYLAHTPTMRVPTDISSTDNVYNAMRATLMETERHEDINTVAIPAFGHGAGGVHGAKVAYQMAKAFLQIVAQPKVIDWEYATKVDYGVGGSF